MAETKKSLKTIKVQGVTVHLDMEVFDDLDLLDMMDDMQAGNPLAFKKVLKTVLRDESDMVFEHLREQNPDNRLTATDASEFFAELMDQASAKN